MVSHAQVMNMLRRNAAYNDTVGSTNGAGYIGGRRRRKPMGAGYIGGCMNCMNAGCMHCGYGGYKGMVKDLYKILENKYPNVEYPCDYADRKHNPHYSSADLAEAMHDLRLTVGDFKDGKVRSPRQEAALARLMLSRAWCNPTPRQLANRAHPSAAQQAARAAFAAKARQFAAWKAQHPNGTRQQFFSAFGRIPKAPRIRRAREFLAELPGNPYAQQNL